MPFLENIATDVFEKPTAAHPFNYWPMLLATALHKWSPAHKGSLSRTFPR
jgi:hypothetical protein